MKKLTFWEYLEAKREELGLSVEEICQLIGFTVKRYNKYQTFNNKVKTQTLEMIAHGLDIPIWDLKYRIQFDLDARSRNKGRPNTKSKTKPKTKESNKMIKPESYDSQLVEVEVTRISRHIYVYEKVEERYDETIAGYKVRYTYTNPKKLRDIGNEELQIDAVLGKHIEVQAQPSYVR